MSVTITTDVFCDGCGRWAHYRTGDRAFVREAQIAAKAVFWSQKQRSAEMLCPECNGSVPKGKYWPQYTTDGAKQIPC